MSLASATEEGSGMWCPVAGVVVVVVVSAIG